LLFKNADAERCGCVPARSLCGRPRCSLHRLQPPEQQLRAASPDEDSGSDASDAVPETNADPVNLCDWEADIIWDGEPVHWLPCARMGAC
jgi:hypothetical protein